MRHPLTSTRAQPSSHHGPQSAWAETCGDRHTRRPCVCALPQPCPTAPGRMSLDVVLRHPVATQVAGPSCTTPLHPTASSCLKRSHPFCSAHPSGEGSGEGNRKGGRKTFAGTHRHFLLALGTGGLKGGRGRGALQGATAMQNSACRQRCGGNKGVTGEESTGWRRCRAPVHPAAAAPSL